VIFEELVLLALEEGKINPKELLRGPALPLFAEPGAARMAKGDSRAA